MSVRFLCRCGKKMKAPDDKIGKKVLCTACGSPVKVPDSDTARMDAVAETSAGASQTASALLRGTGDSSEAKPRKHFAFDDDHTEEEGGYDFTEALRQVALVLIPGFFVVIIVIGGAYWLSSQLFVSDSTPELGRVSGRVTLDGEPLKRARIEFRPVEGKTGSKLSNSIGKTNNNGMYRMIYSQDHPGAVVGQHRVQISATVDRDGVFVPARFENQRKLTAEVESGANEIDFELKSVAE